MFEQSFVDGTGKTNKPWTVAMSFLIQAGLITVLVILPMIFFEGLQPTQLAAMLVAPPPPPPPKRLTAVPPAEVNTPRAPMISPIAMPAP